MDHCLRDQLAGMGPYRVVACTDEGEQGTGFRGDLGGQGINVVQQRFLTGLKTLHGLDSRFKLTASLGLIFIACQGGFPGCVEILAALFENGLSLLLCSKGLIRGSGVFDLLVDLAFAGGQAGALLGDLGEPGGLLQRLQVRVLGFTEGQTLFEPRALCCGFALSDLILLTLCGLLDFETAPLVFGQERTRFRGEALMLFLLVPRLLPKCGLPGFIGLKGLRIDPVEVILATGHALKRCIEELPLVIGFGFFLLGLRDFVAQGTKRLIEGLCLGLALTGQPFLVRCRLGQCCLDGHMERAQLHVNTFDAADAFLHPVSVGLALQDIGHVGATVQPGGHILPALLEFAHVLALRFRGLVLGHALQHDVLQVPKADLLIGHRGCNLVEIAQGAWPQ